MKQTPLQRKTELTRHTPMKKKSGKRKKRPTEPCRWSTRCYTPPSRVVGPNEMYCAKHLELVADSLFSKVIRARDGRCQECGSTENLQCAHVLSRGCKYIRFDLENAFALCAGCHFRFTKSPSQWIVWVELHHEGRIGLLSRREAAGQRAGGHVDQVAVIHDMRRRLAA